MYSMVNEGLDERPTSFQGEVGQVPTAADELEGHVRSGKKEIFSNFADIPLLFH